MKGKKCALISGVTGQTGAYLAHYLINCGYNVIGGSRDAESANRSRLVALGIDNQVKIVSLAPADFHSVSQVIMQYKPDEIYYLAGQTSVGLSFEQPFEAFESIAIGTLNFLEAIRLLALPIRFFNAGSTECFGDSDGQLITEDFPMRPVSPYAVAKSTSYWMTANYRNSYNMFACTGLLSNHESPLRPRRFVISKVVSSIHAIMQGRQETLELGNIDIARDWGWAPDYVKAIHLMIAAPNPNDYIIATGQTHSLLEFVELACSFAGISAANILKLDHSLLRPTDLSCTLLSADKIKHSLGWQASTGFEDIAKKLFFNELF